MLAKVTRQTMTKVVLSVWRKIWRNKQYRPVFSGNCSRIWKEKGIILSKDLPDSFWTKLPARNKQCSMPYCALSPRQAAFHLSGRAVPERSIASEKTYHLCPVNPARERYPRRRDLFFPALRCRGRAGRDDYYYVVSRVF